MVLPTVRDPRLGTLRRGGTLTDADHHLRDHPQHRRPGAARELRGAARFAAYAAGQAACVAHVAEHDLGAAAYAIEAVGGRPGCGRRTPGVPLAARPAARRRPGPRARRPAATQRPVLVGLRRTADHRTTSEVTGCSRCGAAVTRSGSGRHRTRDAGATQGHLASQASRAHLQEASAP